MRIFMWVTLVTTLICGVAVDSIIAPELSQLVPSTVRMRASATAYCLGVRTQSGALVHEGIVASDPKWLPQGSVIRVSTDGGLFRGIYTVLDTGASVIDATVDIYMRDCLRASAFRRQAVWVEVIRRGWDPVESADRGRQVSTAKLSR